MDKATCYDCGAEISEEFVTNTDLNKGICRDCEDHDERFGRDDWYDYE